MRRGLSGSGARSRQGARRRRTGGAISVLVGTLLAQGFHTAAVPAPARDDGVAEERPRATPYRAQRSVSFSAPDGGVVYADLFGEGEHAVVLAHGGRFTKESWSAQVPELVDAGLRVLAIDFRGRGASRGPPSDPRGENVHLDVLAAVRFLRDAGADHVSVVGASFGGGAAARAAVEAAPGEIARLVLLAHSPIATPERIQGRKLFILSRDDFSGGGTPRLPSIRDQYERAPEPKKIVILEGSAHAQLLFQTDQGPRLLSEIVRFLTAS